MKVQHWVFLLTALCISSQGHSATITYGGSTYHTVDWISADDTTDTATGTAGGISVTFSTFQLGTTISTADYTTDPAFDAVGYPGGGMLEQLEFYGVLNYGTIDSLTFGSTVNSVLLIIGSPNATNDATQYGPSRWDFDDTLGLSVIDTEGSNGLEILAGNILNNGDTAGPNNHRSGIVQVNGVNATALSWEHVLNSTSNSDKMKITFAISAVPVPPAIWLFVSGLLALFGIRKQQ